MSSGFLHKRCRDEVHVLLHGKVAGCPSFSVTAGSRLLMPMIFTFLRDPRRPPRAHDAAGEPALHGEDLQVDEAVGNEDVLARRHLVREGPRRRR